MNRFFFILSGIAFIGVIALMVISSYWLFFPQNIVSYPYGTVFPVVTKTVTAGSFLQYQLKYCKYKDDLSLVFLTLVGQSVYTLVPVERNLPIGCQKRIISDTYIPPTVPPGTYQLYITVEYRPNPLRVIQYYTVTKPFKVIN